MKTYKGKEVIYCGILLSGESKKLLKETTSKLLREPIPGIVSDTVESCDHVTLAFGKEVTEEQLKMVGTPVTALHPWRLLVDDIGCGLFFDKKEFSGRGIQWINSMPGAMPHVTLYVKRGIPAQYIGTISERNHSVIIADPTRVLNGVIGVYTPDGWIC